MDIKNQSKQLSPQQIKQRNFLMVFPALVLPFVTFLLWSVGAIGQEEKKQVTKQPTGFKMDLPSAVTSKDSNWNKLKFYEQADKDSAEYRKLQKSDPYYKVPEMANNSPLPATSVAEIGETSSKFTYDPYPGPLAPHGDPNEEKVYKKLAKLNEELKAQQEKESSIMAPSKQSPPSASVSSQDIDRLENMMQMMQSDDGGEDKEMQQISGVLDKILDIQYPDRVKERVSVQSQENKRQVFAVQPVVDRAPITRLDHLKKSSVYKQDTLPAVPAASGIGFHSFQDKPASFAQGNAIGAIIPKTQSLVTGSIVQLQFTSDIVIAGIWIPKDHFIHGMAALNGERLYITISSILYGNSILPVELSVYDLDGLEGIYIPGSISRDVTKQSGDQALQSMSLTTLDPSLGAQAANAGIQAAKSLIGKKAKLIRVTVKDGYSVFLKDKNLDK
ncbi:MAG: conjugative transposon protein TraM [Sphingobacteriales bacterium]|nr:conjugative transposon protein TraM [Sphingobacteriales bacterium]OJW02001.1 MAG: conjugative transposon protein TraM [Sphingobacteriales bacterium 44-61]